MHLAVDELPGRTVLDATGRVVGEIERLLVDSGSWAVDVLRVKLRRAAAEELGLDWSTFRAPTIDVPTGLVMAAGDAIILRAALDELSGLAHEARAAAAQPHPAH